MSEKYFRKLNTAEFAIPIRFALLLLESRAVLSAVPLSAVCSWWKVYSVFWSCSHITSIKAVDTSRGSKSSQELRTHENCYAEAILKFVISLLKLLNDLMTTPLQLFLHSHLAATVNIWSRRVQANLTALLSSMAPDVEAANQPWFISAQLLLVSVERTSRMPHLMTNTRSTGW